MGINVVFIGKQITHRHYGMTLLVLFLLAWLLNIMAINCLVGFVLVAFGYTKSLFWHPYSLAVVLSMLVILLIGTLFGFLQLWHGGHTLAQKFGARLLTRQCLVPEERMLIEITDDLSRSCGVSIPAIYILDEEISINAFIVGYRPADMALIVTWGMLQTLDRLELQGVIAHEYSHVLHGNTYFNARVMVLLSGLLIISQLGSRISRFGNQFLPAKQERSADALFVLIGGLIWLFGSIGILISRVLKYLLLHRRWFLADAASAKYVHSNGLLRALLRIRAHEHGSELHGVYVETMGHMCFAQALNRYSWFSAHPALDERIYALSPATLRKVKLQERIQQQQQLYVDLAVLEEEAAERSIFALEVASHNPQAWQPPQPFPFVRMQPATRFKYDAVSPLAHSVRIDTPYPDMIRRAMSTSTGCREVLVAIMSLRQKMACSPEQQHISRAILETLETLDQRLYVSIFLQAINHMGHIPVSAGKNLLTRLATIIQADGFVGLLDILLLEKLKAKFGFLPAAVPVSMDHCIQALVLLVDALLHVREITEIHAVQTRTRILRTILTEDQLLGVNIESIKQSPVNLGHVLYQLSGLLSREKLNVLTMAEAALYLNADLTQEEQDVLDLLYWRLGFESYESFEHSRKKMVLEI